ncbi:MAG: hypothetical protein PHP88_02095 [bacterium]|nr:hypothetical protein [bacterium]
MFLLAALSALAPVVPALSAADAPHPSLSVLEKRGGWKPVESPRIFGPDNLYEEIDGEAELFLPYGMERLTVALLGRAAAPGTELRLELFRMASPRDAYGIFSQHRYPDQEVLRVGSSEVAVSDTTADFFRGETFVRIRAKPGEGSRKSVTDLARDAADALPGDGAPPGEAGILERFEGRIAGSIIYQKRAMLGYTCLSPGFEGRFSRASASGRVVLLPPVPGKEDERWMRLARELPGYRAVTPALYRADLRSGTLWISRAGACVVGVVGNVSREEAETILSKLAMAVIGP